MPQVAATGVAVIAETTYRSGSTTSTNGAVLEKVFSETLQLSFQMNGSNVSYPVASVTGPLAPRSLTTGVG